MSEHKHEISPALIIIWTAYQFPLASRHSARIMSSFCTRDPLWLAGKKSSRSYHLEKIAQAWFKGR
jgi:hypothetical protein